jgi:hypothetical protein
MTQGLATASSACVGRQNKAKKAQDRLLGSQLCTEQHKKGMLCTYLDSKSGGDVKLFPGIGGEGSNW